MHVNRIGSLAIALLALFALAFAAATLDSTTANPLAERTASSTGSGGGGGGSDVRVAPDNGGSDTFDSLFPQFDVAGDRSVVPSDGELDVLFLAACLLAVGIGAAVFLLTGDDETAPDERTAMAAPSPSEGRSAAVPKVEQVPPTNDVYRAWNRMVELVEPVDDARTPREIAARARDAGLPDRPVEELTSLFRAVRYGQRQPTDRREGRATDAVHRLGESESDASTDKGDA